MIKKPRSGLKSNWNFSLWHNLPNEFGLLSRKRRMKFPSLSNLLSKSFSFQKFPLVPFSKAVRGKPVQALYLEPWNGTVKKSAVNIEMCACYDFNLHVDVVADSVSQCCYVVSSPHSLTHPRFQHGVRFLLSRGAQTHMDAFQTQLCTKSPNKKSWR